VDWRDLGLKVGILDWIHGGLEGRVIECLEEIRLVVGWTESC
jgi:hypothetical protein